MNEMNKLFEIVDSDKYGPILTVLDLNLADEFDDFLNEDCFVLTQIKFFDQFVKFYFGQAACVEKIDLLVGKFTDRQYN